MKSLVLLMVYLWSVNGFSIEIDQYTLPPTALVDMGPMLTQKIVSEIKAIIDSPIENLKTYTSPDYPALMLHKAIGLGKPVSNIEFWIHRDPSIPAGSRFRVPYGKSIFNGIVLPVPFTLLMQASTVNIFGHYIGSDKVGHIFQEGYEYKQILKKKFSLKSAVDYGVSQEHGIYGTTLTGVFSNADLAANYSGLKFYLNLTEDVQVGNQIIPAILKLENNLWTFASTDTSHILEPFFSDHLNEALNPSQYKFQRGLLRRAIHRRCSQWFRLFPNINLEDEMKRIYSLSTWYGENYGWSMDENKLISIATECFIKK